MMLDTLVIQARRVYTGLPKNISLFPADCTPCEFVIRNMHQEMDVWVSQGPPSVLEWRNLCRDFSTCISSLLVHETVAATMTDPLLHNGQKVFSPAAEHPSAIKDQQPEDQESETNHQADNYHKHRNLPLPPQSRACPSGKKVKQLCEAVDRQRRKRHPEDH